ncbi:MAG: TrmH family RNA methyltransferase [Treponema sp.]|nr:TrmH family RNA methyltransferase [Treponema sp.]
MIPLQKLTTLPRSQRLRKAAKILGEADRRIAVSALEAGDAEYLCGVAELLAKDESFSPAQTAALKTAQAALAAARTDAKETRRALNTVYHILLAETGRYQADWDFIETSGALDPSKRHSFPGMQIYLEDIRSPFNVGSMFRAAESFGAEKLWLSPLCADPRHKRAERTAMGCVDILPWERLPHDPFAADTPFSAGPFFTLETGGIPLAEFPFPPRGILIAGSEELGVSPQALAVADASLGRVTIPTYGAKGSLNVSVAFGIVMQAWAAALGNLPACGIHPDTAL